MCSTVTVFSLSVSAYVGAPPTRRNAVSTQDNNVGRVRSQAGITTRNRDQASHRQNSSVARAAPPAHGTTGPTPQSNWHHIPGSVIHGRYVRRCPARQQAFASATARRVVRSSPSNPTATNRSCTTSARTCPRERSTQGLLRCAESEQPRASNRGWSDHHNQLVKGSPEP